MKTAVVTGGSKGLGLATALALARHGWSVTIGSRDEKQLASARETARTQGLELEAAPLDVTSEPSVRAFFARVGERGPLHLCVNSAGTNLSRRLVRRRSDGTLERHSLEDWERSVRLCLTGVFLCGREAAASMLERGEPGVIVNIASAVYGGAFGQSAYAAAKAGVVSLTRSWALELAEHGIRVAAIAPGVIDGQLLREKSARHPAHAAYMQALLRHVPLQRWAREEEIAEAVLFVASNSYVTGTVLEVDGGGLPGRALQSERETA